MSSTPLPRAAPPSITSSGLLFLAITSVSWGLNFPVMKIILREWPPLTSRGLAGLVGAALLALIAIAMKQDLRVPRHFWLRLIGISLLTVTCWVSLMGLALLWLPASEAAVIAISVPVWVSIMAWPILGERISLMRAAALAVALGGIMFLIGGKGIDVSLEKMPGIALGVAAAILVAGGTIALKRFPLAMPPVSLSAWQIGLGSIPVALAGLVFERPPLSALSATGWASMAYLIVVQFCVAYVCWFAALARLAASTAAIGTLMVPVIGVLASALILYEPLGLRELVVLALTIGGVAVAMRS